MEEINNYYVSVSEYENNSINNISEHYFSNNYLQVQKDYINKIKKCREELSHNDAAVLVNEINKTLDKNEISAKIVSDINKYKKYDYIYYIEKLSDNHLNNFNIYQIMLDENTHWSYLYNNYSVSIKLLKSVKLQQNIFYYDAGFNLDNKLKTFTKNEDKLEDKLENKLEKNSKGDLKQKLLEELKIKLSKKNN